MMPTGVRWLHAAVAATCVVGGAALAQGGAPVSPQQTVVLQPRPFGYTVGDIVTQRVLLARDGKVFTPASLPAATRTNAWLERRAARMESFADGSRWLVVDYQVVNAPRALATVALPAWELAGPAGTPALRVPPATITVGPLTAPVPPGQALPLRADRPAPAIATAPMQLRLWSWLGALAAVLCAWVGYAAWIRWRERRTLPFAGALRELRSQGAPGPAAHLALHHAFDRTAGQVVHAGSLPTLFERAPYLQSLRPQIERFYAQSAALFFGGGRPADALALQALCRSLLRLQRRHGP